MVNILCIRVPFWFWDHLAARLTLDYKNFGETKCEPSGNQFCRCGWCVTHKAATFGKFSTNRRIVIGWQTVQDVTNLLYVGCVFRPNKRHKAIIIGRYLPVRNGNRFTNELGTRQVAKNGSDKIWVCVFFVFVGLYGKVFWRLFVDICCFCWAS